MDAKDFRIEPALGERSSDVTSKYTHLGTAVPCSSIKSFPEISSNPLAKVDTPTSRPCAVIGPDRVLPPPTSTEAYMKKSHLESWPPTETMFRHPPEYPYKNYQSPIRNISPRQTFQENMQRIMVAPTYNSVKTSEGTNFVLDTNVSLPKNKLSGAPETKYCDVPYSINHLSDNQKNTEVGALNINHPRNCPPIWHPNGVNIRPTRPYGGPELYQLPEYANCAGQRPMVMPRPPRTMNEENSHPFSESFFHHGNIRFKPYPNVKDRYAQARYEYINNYPSPYHPPPPIPRNKFDMQKPVPPHASYPHVPIKYLENRISDSLDGYQRSNQQINYNASYQNQMIHPAYGSMLPNSIQNKFYPYPPDKTMPANKLPYENNKLYVDYDNSRNKSYPVPESFYINEVRPHVKGQVIIPSYPVNMQYGSPHPYYRKENHSAKGYDHIPHFTINSNNHMPRMAPQFSPNAIAISPSDSNTSNDTALTQSTLLEDCGYVSQSSSTSTRSVESGIHRMMHNDIHRRYSYGYPSMVQTPPFTNKVSSNINPNISQKDKKGIDVRQFLQTWNEGDDENANNSNDAQINYSRSSNKYSNQLEEKTQEQLYVLGLVNVPSDELGKYEHIQKVSKLPDNIKGYNNIELLKQFEEAIESSNLHNFNVNKTSTPRYFQSPKNSMTSIPARPVSPLDVEAKISQSVIHKEVGCNFEIKPCSPEMLNVEVAAPVRNILEERVIEKVTNPYQSPVLSSLSDNGRSFNVPQQEQVITLNENNKIPSCKLINTQCSNSDMVNVIRADYSLQDLESNSGVCLASLPRLDNDIELNFPEVNQQFINANKDTVITSKDSQVTSEVNQSNLNNNTKNASDLDTKTYSSRDSEKEFLKLSKYRKNKKSESELKEHQLISNSQLLRTDSVIIKNPENTKCFEDVLVKEDKSQTNELMLGSTSMLHCKTINKNDNYVKEAENNIAIDFSVSKSTSDIKSPVLVVNNSDNSNSCFSDNISLTEKDILHSNENIVDFDSYNLKLSTSTSKLSVEDMNIKLSELQNNYKSTADIQYTDETSKNKSYQVSTEELHGSKDKKINVYAEATLGSKLGDTIKILDKTGECNVSIRHDIKINHKKRSDISVNLVKVDTDPMENNKTVLNSSSVLLSAKCGTDKDVNFNNKGHENITREIKSTMTEPESFSQENQIRETHRDETHSLGNKEVPAIQEDTNISNNQYVVNVQREITVKEDHHSTPGYTSFEPNNFTNNKIPVNFINVGEMRSCNLKKELFSPWIQKLIQSKNILQITQSMDENFDGITIGKKKSHRVDVCDSSSICSETKINKSLLDSNTSKSIIEMTTIPEKFSLNYHETESVDCEKNASISKQSEAFQLISIPMDVPENFCPTNLEMEKETTIQNIENSNAISKNEDLELKTGMTYSSEHNDLILCPKILNENPFMPSEEEKVADDKNELNFIPGQTKANLAQPSLTPNKCYSENEKNKIDLVNIRALLNGPMKDGEGECNKLNVSLTKQNTHIQSPKTITDKPKISLKKSEYFESLPLDITTKISDDMSTNAAKNSKNVLEKSETIQLDEIIVENCENVISDETNKTPFVADKNVTEPSYITTSCVENKSVENLNYKDDSNISYSEEQSKTIEPLNQSKVNESTDSAMSASHGNDKIQVDRNIVCSTEQNKSIKLLENITPQQKNEVNKKMCNESKEVCPIPQSETDLLPITIIEKTETDVYPEPTHKFSITTSTKKCREAKDNENILCLSEPSGDIKLTEIDDKQENATDMEFGDDNKENHLDSLIEGVSQPNKVASNFYNEPSQGKDENVLCFSKQKEDIKSPKNIYYKHKKNTGNEFVIENKEISLITQRNVELQPYSINEKNGSNINPEDTTKTAICISEQNDKSDKSVVTNKQMENKHYSKDNEGNRSFCKATEAKHTSHLAVYGNQDENKSFAFQNEITSVTANDFEGNIDRVKLVESNTSSMVAEQDKLCFIQNVCEDAKTDHVDSLNEQRRNLKRSLSDSAIDMINHNLSDELRNGASTWSKRRRKNDLKFGNPDLIPQTICENLNNRRNSISSLYNEGDLSFCIVIDDDYIITQGDENKICFAEFSEELPVTQEAHISEDVTPATEILLCPQEVTGGLSESFVLEISDENDIDKSWVDDIGCVETVVSDDVAEDVPGSASSTPKGEDVSDNDVFNSICEHTDKVKYIYGDKMCNDDAEFVETLYRTPQMNVNKTLSNRESHTSDDYYDFNENNDLKNYFASNQEDVTSKNIHTDSGLTTNNTELFHKKDNIVDIQPNFLDLCENKNEMDTDAVDVIKTQDDTVNSCESSIDNVFLYNEVSDHFKFETPSSPEVSSTTSEEKSSSILLKITNYKGMRKSQLNETNIENSNNCCKFTENNNYTNCNNSSKPGPLITKGAQKYIPPLNEPLNNLKVKLPLPQQSLLKLKQLKIDRAVPKQIINKRREISKKPKPKFEDVLKSIDEIQFKMHKEKNKRLKKSVPKVIIKKNENGSHYASVPSNTYFNPDLTGRKWQPWVFIEKNSLIDKMAVRKKTKAIFNHRKNTYVLADKFQKYKAVSSAKFIITQPNLEDSSMGHLKYTIKLKHTR